jgi:hypothetical protein
MYLLRNTVLAGVLTSFCFTSACTADSVPIPSSRPIQGGALSCEALLFTSIQPNPRTKNIEIENGVGTDKVAIEILGPVLKFMTQASVGVGQTDAAEFQIMRNDEEVLVAISHSLGALGSTLNSLLINKKNGLAVWTKSRPFFIVDDEPDTQAHYLRCQ